MEDSDDRIFSRKTDVAPETMPRFKAGDVVRRCLGGQRLVVRKTVPLTPEAHRLYAEGGPVPSFEYLCHWFEGTQYKTATFYEFELIDERD